MVATAIVDLVATAIVDLVATAILVMAHIGARSRASRNNVQQNCSFLRDHLSTKRSGR
jgi:hypothetical protein